MLSQEARTVPPPGPPAREAGRQLALPLPPCAPPAPTPAAGPPPGGGVPVPPRRVWARLPPPARAEVRRVVWRVMEEVLRDEPRC
jgi:hypothetical protein